MLDTLKELLASKKAIATICGVLVVILSPVAGYFGYEVDNTKLELIVSAIAAYVVGQGVADHGSTAAQIQADAPPLPVAVPNDPNTTVNVSVSK